LLDFLGVERAVVGGISLGAAIALRIAVLHRDRALSLILARPAWVAESGPERLRIYREVACCIDHHGIEEGRALFERSSLLAEVEAASPDNAASLRSFFDRRDPPSTVALLSRIPAGGPDISRAAVAMVNLPTLVVGNDQDYVHPLAIARELAFLIPGASMVQIASKSRDRALYTTTFREALAGFLATQAPSLTEG
jgi:pimeloyl-ACP methyl ester carboxylesterase